MNKEIMLNDLPQYSSWIGKILGNEVAPIFPKSPASVEIEYNQQKWNWILQYINSHPGVTIDELDRACTPNQEIAGYSVNEGFHLKSRVGFHQDQLALYSSVINSYIEHASAVVELGAGYGSIILNLIRLLDTKKVKYFAGEYTENGLKALKKLAKNGNIEIKAGYCDFFSLRMDDFFYRITNSIVFTSHALVYVPVLTDAFIEYICKLSPKYCIHFEPCYEHYENDTLHGLLCRKYVEINDYNRNLVVVLKNAEEKGKIEIIREDKKVFANNVLFPMSVIVWKPRD